MNLVKLKVFVWVHLLQHQLYQLDHYDVDVLALHQVGFIIMKWLLLMAAHHVVLPVNLFSFNVIIIRIPIALIKKCLFNKKN
jgi:hypothetical protein